MADEQTTADTEMLEIFIEEAQEVLADIHNCVAECFPVDDVKSEPLKDLRRFFHTLKGSGRMVGATTIADLAWPIEEMLTNISEGKAPLDGRLQALITDAATLIPIMIEDLQKERPHTDDYKALVAIAKSIAFPDGAEAPAAEPPTEEAAPAPAPAPAAAPVAAPAAEASADVAALAEQLSTALARIDDLQSTIAEQQKVIAGHTATLGDADTAFTGFSEQLAALETARSQDGAAIESVRHTAENALQAASAAEQAARQFIAKQEEAASLRNDDDEFSKLNESIAANAAAIDANAASINGLRETVESVQAEMSAPAAPAEPAVNVGLLYGLIAAIGLVAIVGCIL